MIFCNHRLPLFFIHSLGDFLVVMGKFPLQIILHVCRHILAHLEASLNRSHSFLKPIYVIWLCLVLFRLLIIELLRRMASWNALVRAILRVGLELRKFLLELIVCACIVLFLTVIVKSTGNGVKRASLLRN